MKNKYLWKSCKTVLRIARVCHQYKLKAEVERKFLGFPKYHHVRFAAPTHFHLLLPPAKIYNSLSHFYSKKHSLSHGRSSISPLELSDLFISPINCTINFLFKSCVEIFFSLPVVLIILLLFKSQRCIFSPLVSLFIFFCCCIHLGTLSCMPL